jgi:hypothetical protein
MDIQDNDKELNPLEKQLEEINEWQKNATNPGYFIGSGKVPLPMRNLLKSPILMLIVGIIFIIPTIYNLVSNFNIATVVTNLITIVIGGALIFGGIMRILKRT